MSETKDLFAAIANGNLKAVEEALATEAGMKLLNTYNHEGEAPLHLATKARHVAIVEALIQAGANVNQASTEVGSMKGYTAAHYAARNGDVDILRLLAKRKVDFNRAADDGWYPLHCSVFSGKRQATEVILGVSGLQLDCKTQHNLTPLVFAANHGRLSDVRDLVNRGASIDVVDVQNDTLMHHVFHYQMSKLFEGDYNIPECQYDVAVYLAIAGADVKKPNREGNLATHFLAEEIPSLQPFLECLSHSAEQFRNAKTEWNYMTILSAKIEHFMGMGLDMKHAVDLYELGQKLEKERVADVKRREAERPAGGCPVMRGNKKKKGAAEPPAAAAASHEGHDMEAAEAMKAKGEDPSGGACPFFKKPAAPIEVTEPSAPQPEKRAAPEMIRSEPREAVQQAAVKGKCPVPHNREMLAEFVYEHRMSIMMMLLSFFFGMVFEQRFGRR